MFINSLLLKFTELKLKYSSNLKKTFLSSPSTSSNLDKLTQSVYQTPIKLTKFDLTLPTTSPLANKLTFDNNVVLYLINTTSFSSTYNLNFFYVLHNSLKLTLIYLLDIFKRTIGDGFIYIRGLFIIFFIDACLTDDEPI